MVAPVSGKSLSLDVPGSVTVVSPGAVDSAYLTIARAATNAYAQGAIVLLNGTPVFAAVAGTTSNGAAGVISAGSTLTDGTVVWAPAYILPRSSFVLHVSGTTTVRVSDVRQTVSNGIPVTSAAPLYLDGSAWDGAVYAVDAGGTTTSRVYFTEW